MRGRALGRQESARVFFEQGRLAELTGDAATAAIRYREAWLGHRPAPRNGGLLTWFGSLSQSAWGRRLFVGGRVGTPALGW